MDGGVFIRESAESVSINLAYLGSWELQRIKSLSFVLRKGFLRFLVRSLTVRYNVP